MLTSSASQYLQPDYLQPISMTLDAKNSPLALLAQTCNSIGKDPTPPKTALHLGEKKDKSSEKSIESSKVSPPPKEKDSNHGIEKELFKLSQRPNKASSPSISAANTSGSSSASPTRSSMSGSPRSVVSNSSPKPVTLPKSSCSPRSHHHTPPLPAHRPHSQSSSDGAPSKSTPHHTTSSISSPLSSAAMSNGSSLRPSVGLSTGGALPYPIPYMGINPEHHLPSSAYPTHIPYSYPSALPPAHSAHVPTGLKPPSLTDVTYTRVKNSSGTTSLVPVCKDPYCSNCQLTVQNSHLSSTCTIGGCGQCAHEKYLTGLLGGLNGAHLGAYAGLPGALPSALHPLPDSRLSGALPPLFPHGALGAHSGLPYICNWMVGSDYCGKRFSNSEELLQHLKSHTSAMDHAALINYQMGLPGLGAASAAYPPPGSLSPTSPRKSYPSLGALDLAAANRYHPYRHMLSGGVTVATPQLPQTISPYYSPYALYGHRLGTTGLL